MKKFIAIIAAIALIATMSVSAFAADPVITGDASKDVAANYEVGTGKEDEIHLTITWTDTVFTFKVSGKNWNETTMKWDDNTDGTWSDAVAKVSYSSASSCPIVVTATYEADEVAVANDEVVVNLAAADGAAVTGEATFAPAAGETITENVTAGTIKVTVA